MVSFYGELNSGFGGSCLPVFECSGLTIHYVDSGEGSPVVFLHSGAGRADDWRAVVRTMSPGFRSVAVDLYGYGETARWPEDRPSVSIDDHSRLVEELIRSLGGTAHIVGHSFGGAVGLRAAVMITDRIETLSLVEPQALPVLREVDDPSYVVIADLVQNFQKSVTDGEFEVAVRDFVDHYSGVGFFDHLPSAVRSDLVGLTPVIEGTWAALLTNQIPLAQLAELEIPTLIIQGKDTTAAEQAMCEILNNTISHSRLELISTAGHMSPMTHPEQVGSLISSHLETNPISG